MTRSDCEAKRGAWSLVRQTGTVYHPQGRAVRYWLCGEAGPVLLLCNGLWSGPDAWGPLVARFHGSHRLLLWEYPGQGLSSASGCPGLNGVRALAEDALLVLEGVDIQQAVVMGQGVGVQVAAEMTAVGPERVVCIVGLCGALEGLLSRFIPRALDRVLPRVVHGLMAPAGIPAWKVLRALDSAGGSMSGGDRKTGETSSKRLAEGGSGYVQTLCRTDPQAGLRLLSSMLFYRRMGRVVGKETPLLLLAGERDRLVSPTRSREMARLVPGARVEFLAGCSHRALQEDPELVARHVKSFLLEHGLA